MNITMETKLRLTHDMRAGQLAEFFASIPSDARIRINKTPHYDQRDPGYTEIIATWTEDRSGRQTPVTAWRDR